VTAVARRFKVSRQSVHVWLRRYAADDGLGDRSSRPHGCPHQMSPPTEAKIVEIRRAHPAWGADRIGYQLETSSTPPPDGSTGTTTAGCCAGTGWRYCIRVQTEVEVRNLTDYDSALGLLTGADNGAA
jgi:hypothetical protein